MIPSLTHNHVRLIISPLVIFILLSFLILAFDQHLSGISPTCAVCKAKISLNDTDPAIPAMAIYWPSPAFYYFFEYLNENTNVFAAALKNKAPPA